MYKCTKCKTLRTADYYRTHNNGARYKTCLMCLPSEQAKQIFNVTFTNATEYERQRFGPVQRGSYNHKNYNN